MQSDQQAPCPPYEMRLSKEDVMEELKQSGFMEFLVDSDLLSYQYIIRAYK